MAETLNDPGMSDDAVIGGTGHGWAHWLAHCDALGGRQMSHAEIARALGDTGVPHWWRQMITVGYERMIGRREPGQSCTGSFAASASRTVAGDMDSALARFGALVADRIEFAGATATAEPRISRSERWRYWRIDLSDGTKVTVMFAGKPGGKASIAVEHSKLPDAAAVASAKAFWKGLIGELA